MKTLLIQAHPNLKTSVANQALNDALGKQDQLKIVSLYDLYPDFKIDIASEQKNLVDCDHLVLQFPIYWYSAPALLKLWTEQVLTYGFAFGPGATATKGKTFSFIVTTGGPKDVYTLTGPNRATLDDFLLPLRRTLEYCSMTLNSVFWLDGTMVKTPEVLQQEASKVTDWLSLK